MTSILFGIVRICCLQLKFNYLQNQSHFVVLLFDFLYIHPISNIFKKKMLVIATLFRKLKTAKDFGQITL